jgi:hypothetical protein
MGFFDNLKVNTLEEFSFVAGAVQTLTFRVNDASGNPINVSGAACTWAMSPLGIPNYVVLTKNGVPSGTPINEFTVTLLTSDTPTLGGMYIQQPRVNTVGVIGQGVINIIPAIA